MFIEVIFHKLHEKAAYDKFVNIHDISITLKLIGHVRDSNPGPLAPKARIIPLDQRAMNFASPIHHQLFLYSFSNKVLDYNSMF